MHVHRKVFDLFIPMHVSHLSLGGNCMISLTMERLYFRDGHQAIQTKTVEVGAMVPVAMK
jgi:hypothetical protein